MPALIAAFAVLAASVAWASAGTTPTLSREQVRQIALEWNAQQERVTGRTLAPVRVGRIDLASEGSTLRLVWHVTFIGGTFVGCGGWWCNLYTGRGGSVTISDSPGTCSGNVALCARELKNPLNRVTGARAGNRSLGAIPLFQAVPPAQDLRRRGRRRRQE